MKDRCPNGECASPSQLFDTSCNYNQISDLQLQAGIKGMSIPQTEPLKWYVMRDLKRPNALLPAYRMLQTSGFEIFTPMVEQVERTKTGWKRKWVPFMRDLLFVHATEQALAPVLERTSTLQYRYVRGAQRQPMIVPDLEMSRFVAAVQADQHAIYYTPQELTPDMLSKSVRIIGGALSGYEGVLIRTPNSRKPRLLVQLQGLLAAGIDVSSCEFLELKKQ